MDEITMKSYILKQIFRESINEILEDIKKHIDDADVLWELGKRIMFLSEEFQKSIKELIAKWCSRRSISWNDWEDWWYRRSVKESWAWDTDTEEMKAPILIMNWLICICVSVLLGRRRWIICWGFAFCL